MATAPQIAANRENAHSSTGPRTEGGKAQSSRNALTSGLFTLRDFVLPEDNAEYAQLCASFHSELNPAGAIEQTFADAIVSAAWRLRRCSAVEAAMASRFSLDPMEMEGKEGETGSRIQRSVDRARAQAHNILHRSLSNLRRLQTERTIRDEIFHGSDAPDRDLVNYRDVTRALSEFDRSRLLAKKMDGLDSMAAILNHGLSPSHDLPSAPLASICKAPAAIIETPPATPRNAPCPCGSGAKHKRCCGKNAAPILHRAA
jgi:hypothetical protein